MVIRRGTRYKDLQTTLRIWLLAGASSLVMIAGVVTLYPGTVQADALLPRPAATAPPAVPDAVATPASLAPQESVATAGREASRRARRSSLLHGLASWYGGMFSGRRTASGEKFNMYAMTACHPTLPFGSLVRVFNRSNKHSVVVRITDRGNLVDEGRIIDLSYAAAQKLEMTRSGLASVDLQVISLGKN